MIEPLNTEKLHVALKQAFDDLKWCENQPEKFSVNMSRWVGPRDGGGCEVCLAGAVMARRLNATKFNKRALSGKHVPTQQMLFALDALRRGKVTAACYWISNGSECASWNRIGSQSVAMWKSTRRTSLRSAKSSGEPKKTFVNRCARIQSQIGSPT